MRKSSQCCIHKDKSHRDEGVTKVQNDQTYTDLLQRFAELLTHESRIVLEEFNLLEEKN